MNTFSVDEYLSGAIDETVIVHRRKGRLYWDHVFERRTDPSVIVTAI